MFLFNLFQTKFDYECHEMRFFMNQKESDLTFIVENQRIPVKKWLLRMKSDVFNKMLTEDFKEDHEIEIQGTKADIFKIMIQFVYCEHNWELTDEKSPSMAMNVFECADEYHLKSLMVCTEKKLNQMISTDNLEEIFVFAKIYNLENLIKNLKTFIKNNIDFYLDKSMDELKRISTSTDNYLMELIIERKNEKINILQQQLQGLKREMPINSKELN